MGKYEKQLKDHAVHASLATLEESLARALSSDRSAQSLIDLEKLQKTTIFIREKIDTVDADLIPIATLNAINTNIKGSIQHINSFLTNYQPQNIVNAIAQLDVAVVASPVLSSLIVSRDSFDNFNLSKSQLDSFIKHVSKNTKDFDKKLTDISNQYTSINSLSNTSKSTIEASIKQSNDLILSLQKQNQDIISAIQKQGQDAIAGMQQQFSDMQSQRSSMFDAAISGYKDKFDSELEKTLTGHNKKFDEHFSNYEKNIKTIIDDSEDKHARIIDLYGIVAGNSVGGEYAKTSQNELETANSLRWWGVCCLCIGIVWVLTCILITIFNGATLGETKIEFNLAAYHAIPAATVTFIIISISAYFLFQSEKHREISLWANQINLELKAFEPFICSIEDEKTKIELRKVLTSQLFGHIKNPQHVKGKTETGLPIEKFFEMLEKLPDALKNKIFPS